MAFLGQGARHQLDQMQGHDRTMTAAENGDAPLAPVLEHGQFLSQDIDPIERRKIKGPGHPLPAARAPNLAAQPGRAVSGTQG